MMRHRLSRALWRLRHTPKVFWSRVAFELGYLPKRALYPILIGLARERASRHKARGSSIPIPGVSPVSERARVFDCITLFDGLDLLEIRMNILDPHVDFFVIVEATTTHAGEPKPLYFAENQARYARYLHKIRHVVVDDMPNIESVKHRHLLTSHQRNQISRGLNDCQPDDIVYVSDFDEIPNPESMALVPELLAMGMERIRFRQRMFYYFLNGETSNPWWIFGSVATRYSTLNDRFSNSADRLRPSEITPSDLNCIYLPEGGWHFSYLGGVDAIIRKIEAFEIAEMDRQEYKTREHILEALSQGKDVFGRPGFAIRYVPVDYRFPVYLRQHQERWRNLIMPAASIPRRQSDSVE
jgi:beta-1,4-mannosyl-glycoprotein beta-1,4-N-acetylglucosaminyltransferase